jgi:TonB family protein
MTNRLSPSARRMIDRLASRQNTLPFFLVVAALIHLALLPLILSFILSNEKQQASDEALSVDLWSRGKDQAHEEDDLADLDENAMVATPENRNSAPSPTATKFLSSSGSSTHRETRKKGMGRRLAPEAARNLQISPPALSASGNLAEEMKEKTKAPEVSASYSGLSASLTQGEPEPPPPLKLRPDKETLSSAITGSGLADLGDLEEGNQTSLNSRAFRHASFFSRVQKMVEQFWRPDHAMEKNDPEAKLIGQKDRVTTLLVVLNRNGQIHHLYTKKASGASFLDQEAIDAIKKAAPFPNVPEGLINETDGLVKFLFQFTVEFNQRPVVRVRKYK